MGILSNLLTSLENATEAMAVSSREMALNAKIDAANSLSSSMSKLKTPEAVAIFEMFSKQDDELDRAVLISNYRNLNNRLGRR
jgi:hypothetical protein